ncbi:MAG: zinc ABC transporter substrate-binding protein [Verrucomicrobiales bacterium]|nr:zinc ABC transporter substrate-binding protein [Verrucomicrobiales bacterium]
MRPLLILLCSVLLFPAGSSLRAAEEKPLIFVPVQPYEWLFERIAGDHIEVHAIVGEGDDAHDYSPSPRELARIAKANLLFSGELGFEGNFFVKVGDGINAPKAINLLDGLELLEGSCEDCHDHGHGEEDHHAEHSGEKEHKEESETDEHHDHDHAELKDPHVWLSPDMLKQQAATIAGILKEVTPDSASASIEANLQQLLSDLDAVDEELKTSLAPLKGKTFYVYHGAFAYFAEAYGLEQKAIEVTGRRPTPKQLAGIAKQATEDKVDLIFVQPQFDQSSAVSLAETIGGTVKELDPLEKDVIANLRSIAGAIRGKAGS